MLPNKNVFAPSLTHRHIPTVLLRISMSFSNPCSSLKVLHESLSMVTFCSVFKANIWMTGNSDFNRSRSGGIPPNVCTARRLWESFMHTLQHRVQKFKKWPFKKSKKELWNHLNFTHPKTIFYKTHRDAFEAFEILINVIFLSKIINLVIT